MLENTRVIIEYINGMRRVSEYLSIDERFTVGMAIDLMQVVEANRL